MHNKSENLNDKQLACSRRSQPVMSDALEETPSHFFKVILSSTLEDKKLMIPEKFAGKFWSELSGVAKLRVPSGLVWQVGLTKYARKIWFKDGWHDFAENHSIKIGYFAVFKYVKNSTFDVLIFDKTACEIQYPNYGGEPGNKKQKMIDKARPSEASVWSSKFKQGHEPPSKESKMEEVVQRNESMHDGNEHEFLNLLEDMGIFFTEKYRPYISAKEKKRAINIARLLKPKNPAFMIILRSSYLDQQRLYVPGKFANKYLTRDVKSIKLRLPNGSECMIKIRWRHNGGFNLTRGWAEIAKTLNLEEGDICIFELIKREDFLLNVSVFYATKE